MYTIVFYLNVFTERPEKLAHKINSIIHELEASCGHTFKQTSLSRYFVWWLHQEEPVHSFWRTQECTYPRTHNCTYPRTHNCTSARPQGHRTELKGAVGLFIDMFALNKPPLRYFLRKYNILSKKKYRQQQLSDFHLGHIQIVYM